MANEEAVLRHSRDDQRLAASMPSPLPRELKDATFRVPDLPCDSPFILTKCTASGDPEGDDAEPGTVLGPFQPDEFVTDPDTNVTMAHTKEGHPVILCVEDQWWQFNGLVLTCYSQENSQEGTVHYLVQPLKDNTIDIEM